MATRRRRPDPERLLRELATVGNYVSDVDCHREFREVFTSTEAGRRVLAQIMCWAHAMKPTIDDNPIFMGVLNGERNLGLKILSAVEVEPPAVRATQAEKK